MRTSKLMTLSVLVAAGIGLTACSGSTESVMSFDVRMFTAS
jgi:hypothetical protein